MSTEPPGFRLDEETHSKLVQLVCFLRQLNYLRNTDDLDYQVDTDADDSSTSILPRGEPQETRKPADIEAELRQILVDAIAFVASVEQTATNLIAISAEELNEPVGIRFRVSMNGEIPDSVLGELEGLGVLLSQLDDEGENDARNRVFDAIVQIRRRNLAPLLKGNSNSLGLVGLFGDARREIAAFGKNFYPPHSDTLEISSAEFEENGAYNADTHEKHMEAAWSYFNELDKLCRKSTNKGKGKKASRGSLRMDLVKQLILLAHKGRHSKCFRHLLTSGDKASSAKLYMMLRQLGRYWQCSLDLAKCAQSESLAPLFQKIEFCSIPRVSPFLPRDVNELVKFLKSIGYSENDLESYCKETKQRISMLKKEFERLQREGSYVHAEIGLIFFYIAHPELSPVAQIGCSKHSCSLCNIFIKYHPHFQIPDTHKKSFVEWGIPDLGSTNSDSLWPSYLQNTIEQTIQDMEKAVRLGFKDSPQKKPLISPPPKTGQPEASQPKSTYIPPVSSIPGASKKKKAAKKSTSAAEPVMEPVTEPAAGTNFIDLVRSLGGKVTVKNKPLINKFCDPSADMTEVYTRNSGRLKDSADYLIQYCYDDLLPDVKLVKGYGFEKCQSHNDRIYLFGLYVGIVKFHEVPAQTLRQWQRTNTLAQNICRTFEECTTMTRGGYYKWFLDKKHLVDTGNMPGPGPPEEKGLDMNSLRKYLPAKDRKTPLNKLEPVSKREVAFFYGSLLGGTIYANGPVWNRLGFSTCSNNRWDTPSFDDLGALYVKLFEKCTFSEFQRAYEQRSLEKLAKDKGLSESVDELKKGGIIVGLPQGYPSCYDLKEYIYTGNMTVAPSPPVAADYGFWGCTSARERELWRKTYLQLFSEKGYKDLDLHKACVSGKIYEYVKKLLPGTPPEFEKLSLNISKIYDQTGLGFGTLKENASNTFYEPTTSQSVY